MVAVSSPAKVLVTGANDYLATWVVKSYLEAGFSVRGTVCSLARSMFLRIKDRFGHYGDRFELVVVEDIARDGTFDEAVKGVDAIAHTASPFNFAAAEPDGTQSTSSRAPSRPAWETRMQCISDLIVPEGVDMRRPMRLELSTLPSSERCLKAQGRHMLRRRGQAQTGVSFERSWTYEPLPVQSCTYTPAPDLTSASPVIGQMALTRLGGVATDYHTISRAASDQASDLSLKNK